MWIIVDKDSNLNIIEYTESTRLTIRIDDMITTTVNTSDSISNK